MKKQKRKEKEISNENLLGLMKAFSKEQLVKLANGFVKEHIELTKWLYDNYLEVLREYEKEKGDLRVYFLGDKKRGTKGN